MIEIVSGVENQNVHSVSGLVRLCPLLRAWILQTSIVQRWESLLFNLDYHPKSTGTISHSSKCVGGKMGKQNGFWDLSETIWQI